MSPEQFVYWLQGFAELGGDKPTPEQWQAIKEHLAEVFKKVTPPIRFPNQLPPGVFKEPFQPYPMQGTSPDGSKIVFYC
jgi:hypothetical protein